MSKQELQRRAFEASGVSYEESLKATKLIPSLYERLGRESGMEELSTLFYDRVFDDTENDWFLSIFASSTKAEAIDNQYRFFVQTFGGPDLYRQKGKGKYTRLAGRHANYPISHEAADLWVKHMEDAINEHKYLETTSNPCKYGQNQNNSVSEQHYNNNIDMIEETKEAMRAYFRYTAHYIVVASEYMRDDQLSGGTKIDEGRVW
ncbi:unnamed protein product [Pseudo-nitzschia multistriata]|uniref:Globin family profile domain-containing protein n=1 Tax=Pseudo-nitzschia multistriata TaxID=183589 RepID=A0A448Z4C6_9STRA|nr:unnamed protein product [Pseudo-nitzschia multistriata]